MALPAHSMRRENHAENQVTPDSDWNCTESAKKNGNPALLQLCKPGRFQKKRPNSAVELIEHAVEATYFVANSTFPSHSLVIPPVTAVVGGSVPRSSYSGSCSFAASSNGTAHLSLRGFKIFNRIEVTSHPVERRWASSAGSIWRSLEAAALFSTIRHHVDPSMGPAFTAARSDSGISTWMDFSRALESTASSVSRPSTGDCWVAWSKV